MTPHDPRHGTVAGYSAHRRAHQPTCQPCRDAMAKDRQLLILRGPALIPANGTQLRIKALSALGYSFEEIANACGWPHRANVCDVLQGSSVQAQTRDRVAAAYDQLSMVLPDETTRRRSRIRGMAKRKGWLPPLALDDDRVDDPGYRPTKHLSKTEREQMAAAGVRTDYDHALVELVVDGKPRTRQLTSAEAAEVCRRLRARGVSTGDLERVYGLKPERYTQTPAAVASTPATAGPRPAAGVDGEVALQPATTHTQEGTAA